MADREFDGLPVGARGGPRVFIDEPGQPIRPSSPTFALVVAEAAGFEPLTGGELAPEGVLGLLPGWERTWVRIRCKLAGH